MIANGFIPKLKSLLLQKGVFHGSIRYCGLTFASRGRLFHVSARVFFSSFRVSPFSRHHRPDSSRLHATPGSAIPAPFFTLSTRFPVNRRQESNWSCHEPTK